ncbi:MAG TPA: hypothetical protein VGU01_05830 [Sphingomicrobium sp.]|nr:hypothetical protein [Sphingomicrobium sp.]
MDYFRLDRMLAGCAAVLINGAAVAATQGSLGTTSTGSVAIGASVPNRVELSGLSDVSFLNQDPATAALDAQNVCVWSNTSTKGYNVTASGSGTASAFTLSNGALTVPYSVEWSQTSGQSAGTALATGTALTGLKSIATSANCATGASSSASLIVKLSTANLQTMQAATTYTGTLTLVVAPE